MPGWSFPRRQRYRRLHRAAASSAAGLAVGAVGIIAASAGMWAGAGAVVAVAAGLLIDGRRWVRLAARSRIGAESEDEVRQALGAMEAEGWRLRHSVAYGGPGDIDSVAIAPTGIAFAIETKTRSFDHRHLAAVRAMAVWLYRRRRRWCRRGALPVLCVVRARAVERIDDGVLIVSLERLVGALRRAAGTAQRPAFVAPTRSAGDRPRRVRCVFKRQGPLPWRSGHALAAVRNIEAPLKQKSDTGPPGHERSRPVVLRPDPL